MSICVLSALSVILLLTSRHAAEQTAPELNRFQGGWVLAETADEKRSDRGDDNIRMVIQGNAVTLEFHGLTTNQGNVEVGSPALKLKTINMRLGNETMYQGVYDLQGDCLTICFNETGKDRPDGLAPKGTQWVEKWRRAKP